MSKENKANNKIGNGQGKNVSPEASTYIHFINSKTISQERILKMKCKYIL